MKQFITLLFAVFLFIPAFAQDMELDEILENHFDVIGQERLSEVQAIRTVGKMSMQGMEIPITGIQMRPSYMRQEGEFQGQKFVSAYDGETAWMVNPFMGSTEPTKLTEDQAKQMKIQADMDGLLYNYEKEGRTVELIGTDEVEGSETYHLKVTTEDEDVFNVYIDAESFVILKSSSKVKIQEGEAESETFFSNYDMVDGLAFPFGIESRVNGNTASQMVFEKVELDPEVDMTIFDMPGSDQDDKEDEEIDEVDQAEEVDEVDDTDESDK